MPFSFLNFTVYGFLVAALASCSTISKDSGAGGDSVTLEIQHDLKLQAGTGQPKNIKGGETISISEPVVLSADGYHSMTIVPSVAGRSNLQIKLIKLIDSEAGDPQKNANLLLGDVMRIQALIAKRNATDAITLIEETQKTWPRVSFLNYLKASAHIVNKDLDAALTLVEDALTKDPDSKELLDLRRQLKRQ